MGGVVAVRYEDKVPVITGVIVTAGGGEADERAD